MNVVPDEGYCLLNIVPDECRYNIYQGQHSSGTKFNRYNIHQVQHLSGTTFIRYNIYQVQHLSDTTYEGYYLMNVVPDEYYTG
jgi:hypothetical protein